MDTPTAKTATMATTVFETQGAFTSEFELSVRSSRKRRTCRPVCTLSRPGEQNPQAALTPLPEDPGTRPIGRAFLEQGSIAVFRRQGPREHSRRHVLLLHLLCTPGVAAQGGGSVMPVPCPAGSDAGPRVVASAAISAVSRQEPLMTTDTNTILEPRAKPTDKAPVSRKGSAAVYTVASTGPPTDPVSD